MATTTNYGWTTPDDTDLVKNGADAIRTLGSAIDTSMNTALGTKKAGLVLLNTTSFSGVASQSLNNIFSATYSNYLVQIDFTARSVNGAIVYLKMRVGGVDNSASYDTACTGITAAGTGTNVVVNNGTAGFDLTLFGLTSANHSNTVKLDLMSPFSADWTLGTLLSVGNTAVNGAAIGRSGGVSHKVATSYDGFNLICSSGNFTGTIKVYGYSD